MMKWLSLVFAAMLFTGCATSTTPQGEPERWGAMAQILSEPTDPSHLLPTIR